MLVSINISLPWSEANCPKLVFELKSTLRIFSLYVRFMYDSDRESI